jgi:hypothetical protein
MALKKASANLGQMEPVTVIRKMIKEEVKKTGLLI